MDIGDLAARTPGGIIGAQILLGVAWMLIAGFIARSRGINTPAREFIMWIAGSAGLGVLPITGHGHLGLAVFGTLFFGLVSAGMAVYSGGNR